MKFKTMSACALAAIALLAVSVCGCETSKQYMSAVLNSDAAAEVAEASGVDAPSPKMLDMNKRVLQTVGWMGGYVLKNGRLPRSLAELTQGDPSQVPALNDPWGNPMIYIVDQDDVVTLMSYGADGKPGGEGENRDIGKSYRFRDANGQWFVADGWKPDMSRFIQPRHGANEPFTWGRQDES